MAGPSSPSTQVFASTMTDLMTSLAVVFILLLVVFLKQAHDQSARAKEDVTKELKAFLQEKDLALKQDPEDPLTLAVAVGESQLRFPVGGASLSGGGSQFIDSFFKSFATKICGSELRDKIDAIIIEGHTDRSGEKTPGGVRRNIALSQQRSFSVLERGLGSLQADSDAYECLLKLSSATGRGSRAPLMTTAGEYDPDQSRRVEIKIRVRSAEQQFKRALSVPTQTEDPATQK